MSKPRLLSKSFKKPKKIPLKAEYCKAAAKPRMVSVSIQTDPFLPDCIASKPQISSFSLNPKYFVMFLWNFSLLLVTAFTGTRPRRKTKISYESAIGNLVDKPSSTNLEQRIADLELQYKAQFQLIESIQQQLSEIQNSAARTVLPAATVPSPPHPRLVPPPPPPPPLIPVPPPPPPPPPPSFLTPVSRPALLQANTEKPKEPPRKILRPAISVEDLKSVHLRKTPLTLKEKVLTESNSLLPRVSLEALKAVKLRKTIMKEKQKLKSPQKMEPATKMLLRRLALTRSPGRTPNRTVFENDEMTPVMTKALQKRLDAFEFSPEEDKENDAPFL